MTTIKSLLLLFLVFFSCLSLSFAEDLSADELVEREEQLLVEGEDQLLAELEQDGRVVPRGQCLGIELLHNSLQSHYSNDRLYSAGTGYPRMFRLNSGNPIIAGDNKYTLVMSDTGALRIMKMTSEKCPENKEMTWGSGTAGKGTGPYRAIMLTNGNFVIRDSTGTNIWQTNTAGQGNSPYEVTMQQNGRLVLRDSAGTRLWYAE